MSGIFVEGFSLRVFPFDHTPAHVHVFRYGAELRVYLETDRSPERVAGRMTASDVRRARRLVSEQREKYSLFGRPTTNECYTLQDCVRQARREHADAEYS